MVGQEQVARRRSRLIIEVYQAVEGLLAEWPELEIQVLSPSLRDGLSIEVLVDLTERELVGLMHIADQLRNNRGSRPVNPELVPEVRLGPGVTRKGPGDFRWSRDWA